MTDWTEVGTTPRDWSNNESLLRNGIWNDLECWNDATYWDDTNPWTLASDTPATWTEA